MILIHPHSCALVYISHHSMKGTIPVLGDMVEGLYMTIIHVKVCIHWKLSRVMRPCIPLVYSSIELIHHISTELSYKSPHLQLWPPQQPSPVEPPELPLAHSWMSGSVLYTNEQMNCYPPWSRGPRWLQLYVCSSMAWCTSEAHGWGHSE